MRSLFALLNFAQQLFPHHFVLDLHVFFMLSNKRSIDCLELLQSSLLVGQVTSLLNLLDQIENIPVEQLKFSTFNKTIWWILDFHAHSWSFKLHLLCQFDLQFEISISKL